MISVGGTFSIPLGTGVDFEFAPRKQAPLARGVLPLREYVADDENALLRTLLPALERDDLLFRPLVLYGPSGTGKTTLALALARHWKQLDPQAKPLLVTAADFARAYANAVDTDALGEFRLRFAQAGFVVIDDLQHLEGKNAAQSELRNLLELLIAQGTRVVLTSRTAPADLAFPADLCSRLAQGLVLPLRWPGVEARREIVARYLANRRGAKLSEGAIDRIAATYAGPSTRLFAALAHLVHVADVARGELDDRLVMKVLSDQAQPEVAPRAVVAAVARQFHVTVKDLKGPSRRQAINEARGVAMYLLRQLTSLTFEQIGEHFGDRDHTTVMHACQKTSERLAASPQLQHALERIVAHFQEGA